MQSQKILKGFLLDAKGSLQSARWPRAASARLHNGIVQNARAEPPSNRRKTTSSKESAATRLPTEGPQLRKPEPSRNELVARALQQSSQDDSNKLLAPVHIPEDKYSVLPSDHPATSILAHSAIVIQRQMEMMNILVGFEQSNRYIIHNAAGIHIGYLAEQDHGIGSTIKRQAFRTHRSFTTHVFDKYEREVLRFHRPFSWISSAIKVYDTMNASEPNSPSTTTALDGLSPAWVSVSNAKISPLRTSDMQVVGETQQRWAPLRRKYNLFLHRDLARLDSGNSTGRVTSGNQPIPGNSAMQEAEAGEPQLGFAQFAFVDEPFLSWDFTLLSEDGRLIGSVNRNFAGLGREIFTDTGVYALRMDAAGLSAEPSHLVSQTARRASTDLEKPAVGMTLDQRAIMLATAVSIDFDYFSRLSTSTGGFWPMWVPWGGGEVGGATGGAAGAAGEAGEAGTVTGGAVQGARGAIGVGAPAEGAVAGAGTMAGYEAMRSQQEQQQQQQSSDEFAPDEVVLDKEEDPWKDGWDDKNNGKGPPGSDGNSSGGDGGNVDGGGDGGGFDIGDWF